MTTAVQKLEAKDASIRELLEGEAFKQQVQMALPKHLTPDRFVRIALTAITRTPKLAMCDKASFFNALLTLSQLGLEPDGRRAHLIPFNNTSRGTVDCQLIVDYKGIVELLYNTGLVSTIHADIVCENDIFDYDRGAILTHKINFRKGRGAVFAVYCIIKFKDGMEKCEVLSLEEIEKVRKRSKAAETGPWKTDYNEMAKKTAARRVSKWVPLSPEQRDIIEADDSQYELSAPAKGENAQKLMEKFFIDNEERQQTIDIPQADDKQTPEEAIQTPTSDKPACPSCGGEMWNNRDKKVAGKLKANAPDYKCKDKTCDGLFWPGQWPPKAEESAKEESITKLPEGCTGTPKTCDHSTYKSVDGEITAALCLGMNRAKCLKV